MWFWVIATSVLKNLKLSCLIEFANFETASILIETAAGGVSLINEVLSIWTGLKFESEFISNESFEFKLK